MPTYDYYCAYCRKDFEAYVAVEERDQLQECPVCGWVRAHRLFSPPTARAVVYANDRNNSGYHGFTGPKHKSSMLKERGWIEIGNESVDTMERIQKSAEKEERERRKLKLDKAVDRWARDIGGDALMAVGDAIKERADNARRRGEGS